MIYDVYLSNFDRSKILEFLKTKKEENNNFKVVDIGAPCNYTNWSLDYVDFVVDLDFFSHPRIKSFQVNLNYESEWKKILDYVEKEGKFDFCVCSHTLEDIALPALTLTNLPKIAKQGWISCPSKFSELSQVLNQPWLGYIHHRWIFTLKDGSLLVLPKLNFLDYFTGLREISTTNKDLYDLSFFWKDEINFQILNNDYLGPTIEDVISYYSVLLEDDLSYLHKNINCSA